MTIADKTFIMKYGYEKMNRYAEMMARMFGGGRKTAWQ